MQDITTQEYSRVIDGLRTQLEIGYRNQKYLVEKIKELEVKLQANECLTANAIERIVNIKELINTEVNSIFSHTNGVRQTNAIKALRIDLMNFLNKAEGL
jgi:hypothetical protein